eukprot:1160916-Pelagomonas_calceolata.AAC.9
MHGTIYSPEGVPITLQPMQNTRCSHSLSPCALAGQTPEVISSKKANKLIAQGCKSFLLMVRATEHDTPHVLTAAAAAPQPCSSQAKPGKQKGKHADSKGLMQEHEVRAIIDEFKDVLVHELPPGLTPDRDVPNTIPTEPGQSPPCRPMYRLSPAEYREVRAQVKDLLQKGYIQPSTYPMALLCSLSRRRMAPSAW